MKSIMLSIKPQWVEKILNGEKTVEIRKSIPKCDLPCKVYIYETKDKILIGEHFERSKSKENLYFGGKAKYITKKDYYFGKGKVIAEFILKHFNKFDYDGLVFYEMKDLMLKQSCLTDLELKKYAKNKTCYAWHIDNLKIYDKPKELSEFSGFIPNNKCEKHENGFACDKCDAYDKEHDTCLALYYCHKPIKRPPQSYMFVEELEE